MDRKRQPNWEPALVRFFEYVETNSELEVIEPGTSITPSKTQSFMPKCRILDYFTRNRYLEFKNISSTLFAPTDPVYPLYPGDVLPKYTAVFSILLHCGRGHYIEHFRHHDSLRDEVLPFDPKTPPPRFPVAAGDQDFFNEFCKAQWRFCALVIDQSLSDKRIEKERVLPIVKKEKLGGGGTANLYLVTLHPAYDNLMAPAFKDEHESPHTYVLKEYNTLDAQSYYDNEISAFRKIHPSPNVINYYGSFTRGGTYNVLLEYADKGTLKAFFKNYAPPENPEDIITLWENIFKLGNGLSSIHNIVPFIPDGPEIFQGWHQDVKPDNVLIVSNGPKKIHEWQFKLADLGISHFKMACSSRDSLASDTYGTRTYGAPECFRPDAVSSRTKLRVNQNIDIWSLACIYSEVIRWTANGYEGITDYCHERMKETSQILFFEEDGGLDCFHNEENALQVVHQSAAKSLRDIRKQHQGCEALINMISSISKLVADMLVASDYRPNARTIWNRQISIVRAAKAGLNQHRSCNSLPTPPTPPNMPGNGLALLPNPTIEALPISPPNSPPEVTNSDVSKFSAIAQAGPRKNSKRNFTEMAIESEKPYRIASSELSMYQSPNAATFQVSQSDSPSGSPSPFMPFISQFLPRPEHIAQRSLSDFGQPRQHDTSSIEAMERSSKFSRNSSYPTPMSDINPRIPQQVARSNQRQISERPAIHRTSASDFLSLDEVLHLKRHSTTTKPCVLPINKDLLNRLKDREFIFLVDDSITMLEHWPAVLKVYSSLSFLLSHLPSSRISLYFTIAEVSYLHTKPSRDLLPFIAAIEDVIRNRDSTTDINIRLSSILCKYSSSLEHRSWWSGPPKPLSLFILTDGVWEDEVTASEPIKNAITTLDLLRKDRRQIGVQFIRFGESEVGRKRLEGLDDALGLAKDIVDTEVWDGNVWKMLLGPISEKFDGKRRISAGN